jgi:hypothetical protein
MKVNTLAPLPLARLGPPGTCFTHSESQHNGSVQVPAFMSCPFLALPSFPSLTPPNVQIYVPINYLMQAITGSDSGM